MRSCVSSQQLRALNSFLLKVIQKVEYFHLEIAQPTAWSYTPRAVQNKVQRCGGNACPRCGNCHDLYYAGGSLKRRANATCRVVSYVSATDHRDHLGIPGATATGAGYRRDDDHCCHRGVHYPATAGASGGYRIYCL